MKHIGLFEGIGGFSLAARWMGWETVAWCEWNEFGQQVLRHHFPEAEGFGDITKTDFTKYANRIDILTGGFPCQPYSAAGKRLGKEDDRHLWPEMLRAIREIQPTWVVGENVLGIVNWNGGMVFDEVQADLEAEGYEVQPYVLPAAAVNAPHRRDRVWFVAYAIGSSKGSSRKSSGIESNWSDFNSQSEQRRGEAEQYNGCTNVSRNAANTSSQGLQGRERTQKSIRPKSGGQENGGDAANTDSNGQHGSYSQHEVNASQGGEYALSNADKGNEYGDAADTDLQRFNKFGSTFITNKQKRQYSKKNPFDRQRCWQNFPTQSPICSRNDGLSTRLDGITFSKWRAESIKAGGNAIVPQVAYQIFKAIQLYNP
jgi:DNA (cytosine-5)-methyltransferase 1